MLSSTKASLPPPSACFVITSGQRERDHSKIFKDCKMDVCKALLASALFFAGTNLPAQNAPLDRTEILGRLAFSYSPSYNAYLVKTHGVSFTPSADFISQVKLAGGEGILVDRLSSAEPVPMSDSSNLNDRSIEHMAK